MRRLHVRLAAACALAVATAAFTGTALAGGNGNGNSAAAPGQQQQAEPTAQSQQAQTTQSSTQAGVKPSSTTKHWTQTSVGASPDVSKKYGNGKTAAQIAASRGASATQPLKGPGNSQPHKTYDCSHKNNKSGGVDVHAIKSYSPTACTTASKPVEQKTTPVVTTPKAGDEQKVTICHATGSATNPYVEITVDEHALKNGHTTAKGDIIPAPAAGCPTATSTVAVTTTAQVVAPPTTTTTTVTTPAETTTTTAGGVAGTTTTVTTPQLAPVTTTAAATTTSTGGVLGAQTSLASPKSTPHRGVLGTVTHIAGGTLPFTGFPVWLAMLIALALILAGIALRRRTMGGARL